MELAPHTPPHRVPREVPRSIRFESVHVLSLDLPLARERRQKLLGMFHDSASSGPGAGPGARAVLPNVDYGVSVNDESVRALWQGDLPAAMKSPFIKQAVSGLPEEDVRTWVASFDKLRSMNKSWRALARAVTNQVSRCRNRIDFGC